MHFPPVQVPPMHGLPQPPQFVSSVSVSTHASSQNVRSPSHTHLALSQEASSGQVFPQVLQLSASVSVSAQTAPHTVSSSGHVHSPLVHSARGGQVCPQ